jgi:thioredoxin reductase (NADPH)
MQAKLTSNDKIEILWYTEATEVLGDGNKVSAVNIVNNQTGETSIIETAGLFFAIGHTPNTAFLSGQVATDEIGYILTGIRRKDKDKDDYQTSTSVSGVFAA